MDKNLSDSDEEVTPTEEEELLYENTTLKEEILQAMNRLRKAKQLCDVILVIGAHEVPAHRAVLATASSFLCDLFVKQEKANDQNGPKDMCKLKDVDFESFQYILDYIYTTRLTVPAKLVTSVYSLALKLRMPEAAKACTTYLLQHMTTANCLGIRQIAADKEFKTSIEQFVQAHMAEIVKGNVFLQLPRIPVVIMGSNIDSDLLASSDDKHMFELVLSWAKDNINPEKPRLDDLIAQTNLLHLNLDNTLTDYKDINDEEVEKEAIVQDYKKKAKYRPNMAANPESVIASTGGFVVRKFSINPDLPIGQKEWCVVSTFTKDNTYLAIAMLNGAMVTISLHYRSHSKPTASGNTSDDSGDSPVMNGNNQHQDDQSYERHASLTPLANMNRGRCGFGLCSIQGKLIACGGYDRGDCLATVECFDLKENSWSQLTEMPSPRGRFSVCVIDGEIYAVGGSAGSQGHDSLICYNMDNNKWRAVVKSKMASLVSSGVIAFDNCIYTVGGCLGQKSMNDFRKFDIQALEWKSLPPLNTARYQSGVCEYKNKIYAIGGTDGWCCLNTMEIFDFETNQWEYGPVMNVARRGAGCEVVNGKIYIVGGSDGHSSLKSTEILDLEKNVWVFGASLNQARANVSVCMYNHKLFAAGGFSGKSFLNSMEYLNEQEGEWCSYLPTEVSCIAAKKANRRSGSNGQHVNGGLPNGEGSQLNGY